jgi:hypothetical protein
VLSKVQQNGFDTTITDEDNGTNMLKRWWISFLYLIARGAIGIRYRIKVTGLEKLTPATLPKKGGIVFLPNHPAEIDPCHYDDGPLEEVSGTSFGCRKFLLPEGISLSSKSHWICSDSGFQWRCQ